MRESRTYGSVRGALSNERPYRDRFARNDGCDIAESTPDNDRNGTKGAHKGVAVVNGV